MKYYSTSNPLHPVSLREAILRSIAPDGGVYMPDKIPLIPQALFKNIQDMSLTDIAYVAATSMFGSDIAPETLNNIVKETLVFPIPLVRLSDNIFALELFHGPTGSFKDVGARFMARIVEHLMEQSGIKKLNVFVATSGDTGCAVGHGFAGIKNVNVYIFHPKGRMLRVPQASFKSPAPNIIPVSIRGSFDDCQRIVKEIYTDPELNRHLNITSANSINIARLLPQTFYYFHAYARLLDEVKKPGKITIATPCGNLGNLTAALFSYQMGLPIDRIIAAGHSNERLWGSIASGQLAVNTFNSKALSTNLARINTFMQNNPSIARLIECHTFNDTQIARQIVETYHSKNYVMDRNTAMACRALEENIADGQTGIFFATAHPAKYAAQLEKLLGGDVILPNTAPKTQRWKAPAEPTLPPLFPAIQRFLLDNNH